MTLIKDAILLVGIGSCELIKKVKQTKHRPYVIMATLVCKVSVINRYRRWRKKMVRLTQSEGNKTMLNLRTGPQRVSEHIPGAGSGENMCNHRRKTRDKDGDRPLALLADNPSSFAVISANYRPSTKPHFSRAVSCTPAGTARQIRPGGLRPRPRLQTFNPNTSSRRSFTENHRLIYFVVMFCRFA